MQIYEIDKSARRGCVTDFTIIKTNGKKGRQRKILDRAYITVIGADPNELCPLEQKILDFLQDNLHNVVTGEKQNEQAATA